MGPTTLLAALSVVLHLAIAVVLLRKYRATRDIAFVWLGVAVVVWPLMSPLLGVGERSLIDRLVRHQWVGVYPFSLVGRGQMTVGELVFSLGLLQQLVGVCLLFVAVLYLSKTRNATYGYAIKS
jgi:hypothetical protein